MKDKVREESERLARGVLKMMQNGWEPADVLRHLLERLVPQSKMGPKYGDDFIRFGWTWALTGMPHVVVDHKVAASLMSTSIPEDFADQVPLPWPAFIATAPAGLLDKEYECSVLVDNSSPKGDRVRLMFSDHRELDDGQGLVWDICQPWSAYASASAESMYAAAVEDGTAREERRDGDERRRAFMQCVSRFVFGACAEMANRAAEGGHGRRAASESARSCSEPQNWTVRITRPVRVDVRAHVREYVSGHRAGLTTQHLRRGHWRNQPYGPRSALRKFIQIEPCWVGPEDAPIAVRPHVLGGPASVDTTTRVEET